MLINLGLYIGGNNYNLNVCEGFEMVAKEATPWFSI